MSLIFRNIVSPGNLKDERITFHVNSDCDVGDYILARAIDHAGSPSTELSNTLWFPYNPVKKGDLIVVYTKSGTQSSKPLKSEKNEAHFFFLGLKSTIWDDHSYGALLLLAPKWEFKSLNDIPKK